MTFTFQMSNIKTLRKNDKRFMIRDNFVMVPRAGIELHADCPQEYKSIIMKCVNNGWLQVVANLTERELIFMGLKNEY